MDIDRNVQILKNEPKKAITFLRVYKVSSLDQNFNKIAPAMDSLNPDFDQLF